MKNFIKFADPWLFIIPILLLAASVAILFSITFGGPKTYLAYHQLIFAVIGIVLLIAFSFFDYRTIFPSAPYFYVLGIVLLILVFFFGKRVLGAVRWLDLGVFQIQPSEIFKVIEILTLAWFFSRSEDEINWRVYGWAIGLIVLPAVLVVKQPDLGTALTLFVIALGIIFTTPLRRLIKIIILAVTVGLMPLIWFFLKDYQKLRLLTFFNPTRDPCGAGYNVLQSIITVGSGGWFGQGLGSSPQSQLKFLPIAYTDFIFASWAEATGFIGAAILLILLCLLIWRVMRVSSLARDSFGVYFAAGVAVGFMFQVVVNIGMNLAVMPVTGIPLPLVSYGGTALVANCFALGLVQSIYMRRHKIAF